MRKKWFIPVTVCVTVVAVSVGYSFLGKKQAAIFLDQDGKKFYDLSEGKKEQISDDYASSAFDETVKILQSEKGYTKEEAERFLYKKDIVVETTRDPKLQAQLEEAWEQEKTFTRSKSPTANEAAMVIMDYEGQIKALKGNRDQDNAAKNYATDELIQIGSTIKPLSVYALAMEEKVIHYSSLVEDKPSVLQGMGGARLWPTNADGEYAGKILLENAIEVSKNTVPVQLVQTLGEEKICAFLREKLAFTTLVEEEDKENDLQPSALALGYLSKGTTLSHLTSCYRIFGGDGSYYKQTTILRVKEEDGTIIYENKNKGNQVISSETSSIMNQLLSSVVNGERGTARNAAIKGTQVIGKTGTIAEDQNVSSRLFVGATPEYIAGVWLGKSEKQTEFDQRTYITAVDVWKTVMDTVTLEKNSFELSGDIVTRDYCEQTGLLAGDACTSIKQGVYHKEDSLDFCSTCAKKKRK
ncbi:multimodular transpeptidase-transglycosylase [Lachnospiraceae bacterium KM106-2]|nr:multimodular transpeptidase-transglycosylase [Lachnospiraceae bacterium KM106-2]